MIFNLLKDVKMAGQVYVRSDKDVPELRHSDVQ